MVKSIMESLVIFQMVTFILMWRCCSTNMQVLFILWNICIFACLLGYMNISFLVKLHNLHKNIALISYTDYTPFIHLDNKKHGTGLCNKIKSLIHT